MKFEIAETTTTGEQSMTEKTETTAPTAPTTIEAQVAAWSATTAELVAAVKATEGITVAGHAEGPKKGRAVVHAQLMTLQGHRTSIEKRRTELKRPILDLGKLVDSEAARLTGIIAPRESELRADRDAYDAEQERIAAEAETKRKAEEAKASEERRKMLERCRELDLSDSITAYRSASRWRRLQSLCLAARMRLVAVMGGVQSGRMAS